MDLLDIEAETVRGGRVDMEYAHITFDDQQHGGNGVEDFAKEAGLCKQAIFHLRPARFLFLDAFSIAGFGLWP